MSQLSVLITGASGFIASHIILDLLAQGHRVLGSVRNADKGKHIEAVLAERGANTAELSFVELDLTSDKGWNEAMSGIDILMHTASPFVTYIPKDPDELVRPAVDGTHRAVSAALATDVKRIVLTSSVAAVAFGHPHDRTGPFGETDWTHPGKPDVSPYVLSKTLAEQKAWTLMEEAGRRKDLTVISPGFVLGPLLEQDIGTSGAIIRKMMTGKFPGAANLYLSSVDVRDVATLHVKAMTDERSFGHRVFAAGPATHFGDIAGALAEEFPAYARKLPTRRLPNFVVRLAGIYDADARASVPNLGRKHEFDASLAETMLGRPLMDTATAVNATGHSLIELGHV